MWTKVADDGKVVEGEPYEGLAGDTPVLLCRIAGQLYATEAICTHAYAHLVDGWLDGDIIECPLHGGQFHVPTGEARSAPLTCDLKTYPVKVEGGEILVDLE